VKSSSQEGLGRTCTLPRAGRAIAFHQNLLAGAIAGLAGGLVLVWTTQAQGYMPAVAAVVGLHPNSGGIALHLVASTLMGLGFAAIFRYQAHSYAAMISGGTLYGLLWWIVGPLTLQPLLMGTGPTWSLAQAGAAFPSLIGLLLYGGVTGFRRERGAAPQGSLLEGPKHRRDAREPEQLSAVHTHAGRGGVERARGAAYQHPCARFRHAEVEEVDTTTRVRADPPPATDLVAIEGNGAVADHGVRCCARIQSVGIDQVVGVEPTSRAGQRRKLLAEVLPQRPGVWDSRLYPRAAPLTGVPP
jgi:hypothetical protein